MIKRPLNSRFTQAVLGGWKTTTIRDKAWPVDTPIMLYIWDGVAYRSKQIDVAAVIVDSVRPIEIKHEAGKMLTYAYGPYINGQWLWEHEGFRCRSEMDDYFRQLVPPGQSVTKFLMLFRHV